MKCQHCGHDLSEHGSLGCMYEYEKPQSDGSLFCSCALTRNNAELTAAQARITELETALRIFVDIANKTPETLPDNQISSRVTHGDLRAARAALEMKP